MENEEGIAKCYTSLTEDAAADPGRAETLLPESLEDLTESPGLADSMQALILDIHSSFSAMFSALR